MKIYVKANKIKTSSTIESNGWKMHIPKTFNELDKLARIGGKQANWTAAYNERYFNSYLDAMSPIVVFINENDSTQKIFHAGDFYSKTNFDAAGNALSEADWNQFLDNNEVFKSKLLKLKGSNYTGHISSPPSPSWKEYFGEDVEYSNDVDLIEPLNYLEDLEFEVLEKLGIECVDTSIQGRSGSITYEKDGEYVTLDYRDFTDAELDMAYSCNSPKQYKALFKNYINKLF